MVYNCVKQYGWDSCSWLCEHPDWLLVAPTLGCVNTWKLYRTMGWTSGCVGSQDDCWCHEFRNAIAHMMPISWYSMTSLHISHAWQFLDSEVRGGLLVKSPQKRLYELFDLYMVSTIWFKSRLVIKVSFWKDSLPEEMIVTFIVIGSRTGYSSYNLHNLHNLHFETSLNHLISSKILHII